MAIPEISQLKTRFHRGAVAVFAVNGAGMALLFAVQVVLARLLGAGEYGVYTYVLSYLGVLTLLGKFGLDSTLQRFVPDYVEKQEWGRCRGVLLRSFQLAAVIALVLSLGLVVVLVLTGQRMSQPVLHSFTVAAIVLPVWVMLRMVHGALLSLKRPVLSHMIDGVIPQAVLLLSAAGIWGSGLLDLNSPVTFWLLLLSYLVAMLTGIHWLVSRALPAGVARARAVFSTRQWVDVAFPLFVMSGMFVIMNYTDIIMLGLLGNTTDSGIYAVASRVAGLVVLPLMFINSLLLPYISSLYHSGRKVELQRLVSLSSRFAGLAAIILFAILWLSGDIILGLFGEEFGAGRRAMNILLAAQLVNVLSGSVGHLMSMTGRHAIASIVVTSSAALNVLMNYLLIPVYGIEGAAVATTVSIFIWNLVFVAYIHKDLDIRPTFFSAIRAL